MASCSASFQKNKSVWISTSLNQATSFYYCFPRPCVSEFDLNQAATTLSLGSEQSKQPTATPVHGGLQRRQLRAHRLGPFKHLIEIRQGCLTLHTLTQPGR